MISMKMFLWMKISGEINFISEIKSIMSRKLVDRDISETLQFQLSNDN